MSDVLSGLTRRRLLRLSGVGAVGLGLGLRPAAGGPAGDVRRTATCVIAPSEADGPFALDKRLLRRDITEGRPGRPLTVRLRLADASNGCRAIRGLPVDLWHCDANGDYSGFDSAGQRQVGAEATTWLRGTQLTDSTGFVQFNTVYPGWYQTRTVHLHVKVHSGPTEEHATQLFLPDGLTQLVHAFPPYSAHPGRDTVNATDPFYRQYGEKTLLHVTETRRGYLAEGVLGLA